MSDRSSSSAASCPGGPGRPRVPAQVHEAIRRRCCSRRTEEFCVQGIQRFASPPVAARRPNAGKNSGVRCAARDRQEHAAGRVCAGAAVGLLRHPAAGSFALRPGVQPSPGRRTRAGSSP